LGLATGRVLQFDQARGYGFVAADDGGEDVFLHSSVFDGDQDRLAPGMRVEFKVMAGDRGRKAFAAHPIPDESDAEDQSGQAHHTVTTASSVSVSRSAAMGSSAQSASAQSASAAGEDHVPDDEQLCDVLSPAEFGHELTESLISNAPTLTGQQILEVRRAILDCARKHGWVDI
jgi:cold shock CspA family protein